MKTTLGGGRGAWRRRGYALLLVLVLAGSALILATGLFDYTSTNARLNHRNTEYQRATAAAEAATEKVVATITADFRDRGEAYVLSSLGNYRSLVPNSTEYPPSGDFDFRNLSGTSGQVDVRYLVGTGFSVSSGRYKGLKGTRSRVRVVSNAVARQGLNKPVGAVFQDIELVRIPIFQFAIFYNMDLEFDNSPPMTVTGPVHCNTNMWLDPYAPLIFNSDVTSAGIINQTKMAINPLGGGSGTITFNGAHDSKVSSLNLPVGTNNSPAAIHAVIEIPPPTEDVLSAMGQQRYYNKADLIILIGTNSITATSGLQNNFGTIIPATQITNFVRTNVTFTNKRELKTVVSTDIDVARFIQWNATNVYLRTLLPQQDIRTLFIADLRPQTATTQPGIRLMNGQTILPKGLTVATPNPLYILGNYNAPAAALGTTNTSGSLPASVAADAVTILSASWKDTNSAVALASRVAGDTTVNSAIFTGIVPTTAASYSGGVENFPRFLEEWTGRTLTYNGSMVAMFNSTVATNLWRGIGATYNIYNPPNRNWAMDQNFGTESKLPPSTPSVTVLVRGSWRTPAPYTTNSLAGF